jgi:hypothetical protein
MLCDPPMKKASPFTAYLIQDALGLKTFIYEDLIALKKLRAADEGHCLAACAWRAEHC